MDLFHHLQYPDGESMLAALMQLLRNDLRKHYPGTCDASQILESLLGHPNKSTSLALPILTTWETSKFCAEGSVDRIIRFMLTLDPIDSLDGLGQLACVVLEQFAPHLNQVAALALASLADPKLQVPALPR